MSKKEAVNGFSKGMNLDLNEQTITNEQLTDAMNASMITGNGDEMILQNDFGNTSITNPFDVDDEGNYNKAALPDGYVPLVTKEDGGVAYMILTDKEGHTQVGSFPGVNDIKALITDLSDEGKNQQKHLQLKDSYTYHKDSRISESFTIFDQDAHQLQAWNEEKLYPVTLSYGAEFYLKLPTFLYEYIGTRKFDDNYINKVYSIKFKGYNKNGVEVSYVNSLMKQYTKEKDGNITEFGYKCFYNGNDIITRLVMELSKNYIYSCKMNPINIITYNNVKSTSNRLYWTDSEFQDFLNFEYDAGSNTITMKEESETYDKRMIVDIPVSVTYNCPNSQHLNNYSNAIKDNVINGCQLDIELSYNKYLISDDGKETKDSSGTEKHTTQINYSSLFNELSCFYNNNQYTDSISIPVGVNLDHYISPTVPNETEDGKQYKYKYTTMKITSKWSTYNNWDNPDATYYITGNIADFENVEMKEGIIHIYRNETKNDVTEKTDLLTIDKDGNKSIVLNSNDLANKDIKYSIVYNYPNTKGDNKLYVYAYIQRIKDGKISTQDIKLPTEPIQGGVDSTVSDNPYTGGDYQQDTPYEPYDPYDPGNPGDTPYDNIDSWDTAREPLLTFIKNKKTEYICDDPNFDVGFEVGDTYKYSRIGRGNYSDEFTITLTDETSDN